MKNHRSNLIPVSAKTVPRVVTQRRSSGCQTERVVLIKEENLTLHACTRFGQSDGGMRRDYAKAVNYINSCHKFINAIIEKNSPEGKTDVFLLPTVTNYLPIFPLLVGKKTQKAREKKEEGSSESKSVRGTSEEVKTKSNFAVKKVPISEAPVDPGNTIPVGDCQEDPYAHVAGIIKEQIHQFLQTLQEDIDKATKKTRNDSPKHKCKNLNIVKQRLETLSRICFLQKNIENKSPIGHPRPPPFRETSEDCSTIDSDTEPVGAKKRTVPEKSEISLSSDSSDIKSDSELEIKTA